MRNAKTCPTVPLPAPPVNVILPLPLTPSPTKSEFLLGDPKNRIPHRRRRSSTFAAIKNWALTVQPGSPVPNPPHDAIGAPSRRSSVSAARDFIARRASVSHHHAPPNSSVAHLVQTPKTGGHKQSCDLTDLGYTSVFARLARTPTTPTPTPFLLRDPFLDSKSSSPKEQESGLKRIKSLGMLKRNRRKSVTATAPSQQPPSRARSHSRSKSALAPSKKSAPPPLPPTLASELLLRQFTDGGSLETHARRIMEEQARAAAPTASRADAPVGTVYRDENGVLWQDEDEKLEREALLPPRAPESPEKEWITFNSSKNANSSPILPGMAVGVGASAESEERRGSFGSINSSFSLSPNSLVTPADGFPYTGIAPFRASIPGGGPPNPLSWSASLRGPISPMSTVSTTTGMAAASGTAAQNKWTRRRPAPLRLNVPSSSHAFDDSFIPSPRTVALASLAPSVGGRRHSSVSGLALTAPPARIEFLATDRDGDVLMKENVNANDPAGAGITRKGLGMKKISKLNLRSMKALFGGHP
ncbi:hypothetical protein D9757_004038 [Collybiopsis confluens]|uniref:Uncharacterized protein n=1 Tax=Collybiopsis confluens TaxID=2823264 RepID=A0A8H5HXD9_9AGAR|nr:hypothetical protein D9757_004038 [Collybiopsis confluens]